MRYSLKTLLFLVIAVGIVCGIVCLWTYDPYDLKYRDHVVITGGFYEGEEGIVEKQWTHGLPAALSSYDVWCPNKHTGMPSGHTRFIWGWDLTLIEDPSIIGSIDSLDESLSGDDRGPI